MGVKTDLGKEKILYNIDEWIWMVKADRPAEPVMLIKTCFVKEIILYFALFSAKDKSLSVFENNVDDGPFIKWAHPPTVQENDIISI